MKLLELEGDFEFEGNATIAPPWEVPLMDAWLHRRYQLIILFTFYVISFIVGVTVNCYIVANIKRAKLNFSAKYTMFGQCMLNAIYILVNFPYKAAMLYSQRVLLPHAVNVFCGWVHLFCFFGSVYIQVSASVKFMAGFVGYLF